MFALKIFASFALFFSLNTYAASSSLDVHQLDASWKNLGKQMAAAPTRAARIHLLEAFHRNLHSEIRREADEAQHGAAYWRAVSLDTSAIMMMDRDCKNLRNDLIQAQRNPVDQEETKIDPDTEQDLEVAQNLCGS